jgi:holo-[acyl-carrier protein] synthase
VPQGGVIGIGIDLVENARMAAVLDRWDHRFKDKVFLAGEQAYCEGAAVPAHHYAGRFAVKEAISKAFGTGVGPHINWLDIEVVRHPESGAPSVRLSPRARQLADAQGVRDILISLSHTHHYAVAQAVLVGDRG